MENNGRGQNMEASGKVVKVAVVQAAPVFLDRERTINKGISLIKEAAENGAQIVAFPEVWIPGYPYWIWMGDPHWGMQFVPRYHENSVILNTPQVDPLTEAARINDIHVVMGFSEKDRGSLYMAQMIIDRTGKIVATRRKLRPSHAERTVYGDGDGSDIIVKQLDIGRVGALNCWEHMQPLEKFAMYSMHEEIHIASWPGFSIYRGMAYSLGPELNIALSQVYAAEGQCFVLMCNAVTSQEMVETLCDTSERKSMLTTGGGFSRVIAPSGEPITKPLPEDAEGIIYADIDLSMISLAKSVADPVGHYARPDVMRLLLNRTPHRIVEEFGVSNNQMEHPSLQAETLPSEEEDEEVIESEKRC